MAKLEFRVIRQPQSAFRNGRARRWAFSLRAFPRPHPFHTRALIDAEYAERIWHYITRSIQLHSLLYGVVSSHRALECASLTRVRNSIQNATE